jgi:hypothetical protein
MLGAPAFAGEVIDSRNPVADRSVAEFDPISRPRLGGISSARVLRIRPVDTTMGSAGNRVRLGVVGVLYEFARWRGGAAKIGYQYLVADAAEFRRVPTRRLARVRRMTKVIPNRRLIYRAPMYGQER